MVRCNGPCRWDTTQLSLDPQEWHGAELTRTVRCLSRFTDFNSWLVTHGSGLAPQVAPAATGQKLGQSIRLPGGSASDPGRWWVTAVGPLLGWFLPVIGGYKLPNCSQPAYTSTHYQLRQPTIAISPTFAIVNYMNNWNQQLQCTKYNQDLDLTNSYKRDNQIVCLADWEAKKQPTNSFFSIQVKQSVLVVEHLLDNAWT